MKLSGLLLFLAFTLSASEVAVLNDGSEIVADHYENNGQMMRLYMSGGTRDVPADTIEEFKHETVLDAPPQIAGVSADVPAPLQAEVPRAPVDARALIKAAAKRHNIPVAIAQSIMAVESALNPDAVSARGAVGLMQVMPATALQFGLNASDPVQNVDAGCRYIRMLWDRYRHFRDAVRRVIAAYNAGPGAVDRYNGVPPFPETRTYVARVLALMRQFQRTPA